MALPLTSEQLTRYEEDGYLLASGLVSDDISRKAADATWRLLDMDADDCSTWTEAPPEFQHTRARIATSCTAYRMPPFMSSRHCVHVVRS